jgi:hypothetical protein
MGNLFTQVNSVQTDVAQVDVDHAFDQVYKILEFFKL